MRERAAADFDQFSVDAPRRAPPGNVSNASTTHCIAATRTAAPDPAKMAAATGCDARDSIAHAHLSNAPAPSAGLGAVPRVLGVANITSVSENRPSVSVPVLSTHATRRRPSRSRCAEPLTSIPRRAATVRPHTATTGVESTSAHGHATSSNTHAVYAGRGPVSPTAYGTVANNKAARTTTGV